MGSVQQIRVKWNNHQSNFTKVFDNLYHKKEFVDVTLACEGQSLKAHKVVLSACSPYFHTLFLENPCKHPIVIMRDFRYSEIEAVVEYMYKGEVNIPRETLREFLRTAQTLQVKGLADDESGETDNDTEQTDSKTYPPIQNRVPDPESEIPPPVTQRPAAVSQQRLSHESYNQPPPSPSAHKQFNQSNTPKQDSFIHSAKRMRISEKPTPPSPVVESAPPPCSPVSYQPIPQTNSAEITSELTETSIKLEVKPFDVAEFLEPQQSMVDESLESLIDESQDQSINSTEDDPDTIVIGDDPEIIEDEPEIMFAHDNSSSQGGLSQSDGLSSSLISALREAGTIPSTSSPQQLAREGTSILPQHKRPRRSRIWHYFQEPDFTNKVVVCSICGKNIPRTSSDASTGNMISHLRKWHANEYAEFKIFKL